MSTGISPCFCTEIERNDPLAEQGDNLLTEGRGKDFARLSDGRLSMPSSSSARLTVER